MTFSPTMIAAMKAATAGTLAEMQAAQKKAAGFAALADEARSALERLQARIAEIDQEMQQPFIPPDDKRVARLLAGEMPASMESDEVLGRAQRNTLLVAEKAQLQADASAVGERLVAREAERARWQATADRLAPELVNKAARAAAYAYADAMRAFVDEHVRPLPWLQAVCHQVTRQDQQVLGYQLNGLKVSVWPEGGRDYKPLWPRLEMPDVVREAGRSADLDGLVALLS